jgi:hypothetical protein
MNKEDEDYTDVLGKILCLRETKKLAEFEIQNKERM